MRAILRVDYRIAIAYPALMPGMPKTRTRTTTPPALPDDAKSILRRFLEAADSFDARHGTSPQAAREQLRREGIITPSGRLTKRYGG